MYAAQHTRILAGLPVDIISQTCLIASGSSAVTTMMCLQDLSTAWNILAAAGSCRTMSGDPKMDSRYIHVRWHACHSSKVSYKKAALFLCDNIIF